MDYSHITRLGRLFIVLVCQILILNNIHILGYITPLILGYMILLFHKGTGRVEILLWGFATGFLFDIFSNTAGIGAGSCTLLAMIQPKLIELFTPRDAAEDFTPGFKVMGFWHFMFYISIGMLIQHTMFYALEAFTIHNWQLTLAAIGGGTLIATCISIIFELLTKTKE